jgi:hypothetical protein
MIHSLRLLLACACLLLASSAWSAPRGLVIITEGGDAEGLRRDVASAVPSNLPVLDPSALGRVKGSITDGLANAKTRTKTLRMVKNLLAKSDAQAVLAARAKRGRGGSQDVRLVLIARSQAEPVLEQSVNVAKDTRAKELAPLLGTSLQSLAAATKDGAPAETAAAAGSADEAASASESAPEASTTPKSGAAPAAAEGNEEEAAAPEAATTANGDSVGIDRVRGPVSFGSEMVLLELGAGAGIRNFAYHDPLRGSLRNYSAPGVPMLSAAGQLYPFANSGLPVLKDFGFAGRVASSLPFSSKTKDGTGAADGSWTQYAVGAHLRVRTSDEPRPLVVGVEVMYGAANFSFSGSDPQGIALANEVPAASYRFVRGGADLRVPIGGTPVSVLAGAGGMHVLSAGAFSDRFPHASINGVDARLAVSYAFAPWLEGKLGAEYTRMFASLKPQPGDPGDIAGGSLDQFVIVNVGASAIF